MGTATGLQAIRHLLEYSEYQRQRKTAKEQESGPSTDSGTGAVEFLHNSASPPLGTQHVTRHQLRQALQTASAPLDEFASKNVLRAYGIPTMPEAIAGSLDEALQAAQQIGYPIALKTADGELHKSDKGGVLLDLNNAEALIGAYHSLASTFGPRVLVQKMAAQGVELILGLVNDAQFGPLLTLGLGGIFVEVMQDATLLTLPATHEMVRAALLGLKGAPLLKGARGRLPANIEAIVDATLRLALLAADLGDLISAVDINPLMALPEGVVAVDALIIPKNLIL
jgi:acyl-CoA synthetase (NDP forming)